MISEGTRQLDLYDFFSILIPGAVFTIALLPFLPTEITLGTTGLVVVLLVIGFVLGRAVHALGIQVERIPGATNHRALFRSELVEPTDLSSDLVETFYRRARYRLPLRDLPADPSTFDLEDGEDRRRIDDIYGMVRSSIHIDSRGRSRTFQAVLDFYRSMTVTSVLLFIIYSGYGIILAAPTSVHEIFPYQTHLASYEIIPAIPFFVGAVFTLSAYTSFERIRSDYRLYYIQYLMIDYLIIEN